MGEGGGGSVTKESNKQVKESEREARVGGRRERWRLEEPTKRRLLSLHQRP